MPIRGKNSEKEEQRAKARRESEEQAKLVVAGVLPVLLNSSLLVFAAPGGMENVNSSKNIVFHAFSLWTSIES